MRVMGAYANNGVSGSKASGRARGSGAAFKLPQESGPTSNAGQATQTSNVQNVDALLALQTVEDSLHGKRRKAVRKGHKILDLLEDVRLGLLSGNLPVHVLKHLERLSQDMEASGDERIDGVLSDISLRAQVELAKLEVRAAKSAN